MKKKIILAGSLAMTGMFLLFSSFQNIQPDEGNAIKSLIFKLTAYYDWYPQQKVYLHIDKDKYDVSERVWFKAYVVNATNHHPDSISTNLYVDLINPSGYIVQTELLKLENGVANGDFAFQDTVPEGFYRIRAYTNWMRNLDENYFFSHDIYVANPHFKTYATREAVHAIRHSHRKNARLAQKMDIRFLPEGGNLLNGVENRVAFKAINALGHPVEVEGRLLDRKGREILTFKSIHDGMGTISFTPETGNRYNAYVKTSESGESKFSLPEGIDMGIVIRADFAGKDSIKVQIVTNLGHGNMPENTRYFLLAHTRGKPVTWAEFDLKDSVRTAVFAKNLFPSGITQFTLFNAEQRPVSERLVFINHEDHLNISITPSESLMAKRKKVTATIQVRDPEGNPVSGQFSLSVVKSSEITSGRNILTNLLLTSDIKGYVEKPDFYFNGWNAGKEKLLDLVMMTNGWRRFNWNTVLLNQKLPAKYAVEHGIEISGKITRQFFKLPLSDILVKLTILNQYNDAFMARSGLKGRFSFTGLDYPDTIAVKLEASRENGKKSLVIYIDQRETSRISDMNYITQQQLKKPGPEGRFAMPVEEKDDDPFAEENNRIYRLYNEPGRQNVIIVDETMQHFQNVAQIIQGRIPGVLVNGNNINIRGINSFFASTDPLFLVDGVIVDKDYALSMSPYDIERIEVLKGPETAIYGSRGANGVIAIYTKRGKFMIKGELNFEMLGYHVPRTYYSPKYDVRPDEALKDDRTTLYWKPDVMTDQNGNAGVSFYTSDLDGTYIINVQGMTMKGLPGSGSAGITVKP